MIFKLTSTVTDSEDIIMDVTVENSAIQPGLASKIIQYLRLTI